MDLFESKKQLIELIKKYDSDKEIYSSSSYNESQLRTDFLDPFFGLLGWDITNSKNKLTSEREVIVEEPLKEKVSENVKKPDYTFRFNSQRKFFVEAKKPSVKIKTDPLPAHQVRRYGFTAKLSISVLSNFEYLAIYDCSEIVDVQQDALYARVRLYHYTEYVKFFDEIMNLLGRESVYSGHFDNEWREISQKIENSKQTVDELFFEQINKWRHVLGSELLKINPCISNNELNDAVQDYINSIIFLRVCEDRSIECYESLLDVTKLEKHKKFKTNLEKADKKYNSGLFKLQYIDQLINSTSSNLWSILKELYYPYNSYSFSVLPSDLLGRIYEQFLGDELVVNNNELILQPKDYNLNRDIISTPNFIIRRIIDYTVNEYCKGKNDANIYQSKFADIACGSGAFLLEVYQRLQDILVDYYIQNDKNKLEETGVNQYKLRFEDKKNLLLNCVWGVDKDFNAVKACRFGLLLKLLENESDVTIANKISILPNLDQNILWGNSLIDLSDKLTEKEKLKVNPINLQEYKFNVIIGNPPYLATEYMSSLYPEEFKIYKSKYFVADKQFDKYYLFIERALNLLNDNGLLGYIIPSKFIKLSSANKLRRFIANKNNFLFKLISFGSNQLFKNKSTYTSIAIFKKSLDNNILLYNNIRDYKKWFDNSALDYGEDKWHVYNLPLPDDPWYFKNTQDTLVFSHLRKICSPLEKIIGGKSISNGIQTSANKEYIHTPIAMDNNYIYFSFYGEKFKIERELTRPYFETNRNQPLYTFRDVKANSFVIYPYVKKDKKIELINISILKEKYPYGFAFLTKVKSKLLQRNIWPPIMENDWYKYGRHQALENCDSAPKIIVGILSKGYKYSVDHEGVFISSGGTAGYSLINIPNDCLYSIYYIQEAILSSKYSEWFVSLSGEVFEGGFIARGTKVQKQIPIPNINFNNPAERLTHDEISDLQKELNQLFSKIEISNERYGVMYRRMFDDKKKKLDDKIKELYNLNELDDIIPSIEDLYS
ncbi:Eco57I restriction-modification methylase domain-containing protein [Mannheimia haemolytica]|uniref:Eco57I restriction-modification methylase domain-containing protein n=1 Tax=Mannheimia haemolytica TaxID=75985 RepID=UPI0031F534B0